jgi:hypothetical protein
VNLGELLYELRYNILRDRSDQVSGDSDQLWNDTTLVRYINEAQRRFARKALILRDGSTTQCCRVQLTAGVNEYALDPSVLAVVSARYAGDTADLARAGHAQFDTYRMPNSYFFDPSQLSALPPGKPLAIGTDDYMSADGEGASGVVNLRVYPVPAAPYTSTIQLRVVRLPLNDFSPEDLAVAAEIPEDHQIEMLDWAAYLALRIVDHDAGNPQRAAEFRASFEDHVKNAKNEAMRKMFAPMQWGFGGNGFTWGGN